MSLSLFIRNDDGTEPDWRFFGLAIGMTTVAISFVIVRFSLRWKHPGLHAEDWLILAAVCCDVLAAIFDCLAVVAGNGIHNDLLTHDQLVHITQLYYIATQPYKPAVGLTKLSILTLYYRVFVNSKFRKITIAVMLYVGLFTFSTTIATIFQCTPVARAWDKSIEGNCVIPYVQWYTFAGFSLSAEAIMFILPIPMIKNLHLPKQQKIGLSLIFCVGTFVIFCGIMRLVVIGGQSYSSDTNYNYQSSNAWTVTEVNVGIICACIPVLKAPFIRLLTLFGIRTDQTQPSGSSRASNHILASMERKLSRRTSMMSKSNDPWSVRTNRGFQQFGRVSEEELFRPIGANETGILKTTTIGVAYDGASVKSHGRSETLHGGESSSEDLSAQKLENNTIGTAQ